MLATLVLLGLVSVAAATDLARHKIYNWTTYPGILAAVALSGVRWLAETSAGAEEAELWWLTRLPLHESLLGLLLCGFLMLACFVFFPGIGGGDVKLMAMLGAFLGPRDGLEALLWTFVLGGCLGLSVLIWRVGPWRMLTRALRQLLWTVRLRRWAPLAPEERAQLEPPLFLAPCALAGVLIVRFQLAELL